MAKPWMALAFTACCTAAALLLPGSREFLNDVWEAFAKKDSADQIGIGASVVALFSAQISAALFWRFKEIASLHAYCKAADDRREVAERRTSIEAAKVAKLTASFRALEDVTPSSFLMNAMLADTGRATADTVIPMLERGITASVEPLSGACRLLARKLLSRDAEGDFQAAESALDLATSLNPQCAQNLELASIVVERNAADAMKSGTYNPSDPRFAPVLVEADNDSLVADDLASELCDRAHRTLVAGRYFDAHRFAAKAHAVAEKLQEPTLRSRSCFELARALSYLGDYGQALLTLDLSLLRDTPDVDDDYPGVFSRRQLRAEILLHLDRPIEALAELDIFADRQVIALGEDHPDVLLTRTKRAQILTTLGRYHEALGMIEMVADRQHRALGPDHPDVLATRFFCVKLTCNLGNYAGALKEIESVVERQIVVLGEHHPDVFVARHERAKLLSNMGQGDAALKEIDSFFGDQSRLLGDDHPYTIRSNSLRAAVLINLGQLEDALGQLDNFADRQQMVLGDKHRDVLATRFQQARALTHLRRYDEALTLLDSYMALEIQELGDMHPDVFGSCFLRAFALAGDRQYQIALDLIEAFMDRQAHVLGADHPDVFLTRELRAAIFHKTDRNMDAVREIDGYADRQLQLLGENHPDVARTRNLRQVCTSEVDDANF